MDTIIRPDDPLVTKIVDEENEMDEKEYKVRSDELWKDIANRPVVGADLTNGILYDGKQIVLPGQVHVLNTDESDVITVGNDIFTLGRMRDIALLIEPDGMEPFILAIENQSTVNYKMSYRIFEYNFMEYHNQMNRFGKLRIQIVPVVLYTGERRWTAPCDLRGIIEHADDHMGLNNWKFKLFDIRSAKLENFHSLEMRQVIKGIQGYYVWDINKGISEVDMVRYYKRKSYRTSRR